MGPDLEVNPLACEQKAVETLKEDAPNALQKLALNGLYQSCYI